MIWSACEFNDDGQSAYMGDRREYELDVWPANDEDIELPFKDKWYWQVNVVSHGFSEECISAGSAATKTSAKVAAEAAYYDYIRRCQEE